MKRALGVALVLASLVFLVRVAMRDWATVQATTWTFDAPWVLLALITQIVMLALGMVGWSLVLRLTDGRAAGLFVLWRLWSLASLARFIPGAVWQFVAADRLAEREGLERRTWSQSLAIHLGVSMAGAAVVAVLALPPTWWWLALVPMLSVSPTVVRKALGVLARVTRQQALTWRASSAQSLGLLLLAAVGWLGSGAGFIALLHALGQDAVPPLIALGVNAASWVAGVAVVIAPSGLGVREVVTAFSLSAWVGEGDAVVLSAVARLWSLVAELLAAALAAFVVWLQTRRR